MPTNHFSINGIIASSVQVAPADTNRNSIYIKNYANVGVNPSQATMWIAFGQQATAGTKGELEVPPGGEYSFGNSLLPNNTTPLKGYPLESINVITTGGPASGCVITQD